VELATGLAIASDRVTTDVVMVNLFPYLAIRYQADDVPTTVINGAKVLVGVHDKSDAVNQILSQAG
jgi:hypothetical protein